MNTANLASTHNPERKSDQGYFTTYTEVERSPATFPLPSPSLRRPHHPCCLRDRTRISKAWEQLWEDPDRERRTQQRGRAQACCHSWRSHHTSRPAHGRVPGSQGGVRAPATHTHRGKESTIRATRSSHKKTEAPELRRQRPARSPAHACLTYTQPTPGTLKLFTWFWRLSFPLSKRKNLKYSIN